MIAKPVVFVVQDYVMAAMLDDVAQRLAARGIEVIRGAQNAPGKAYEFPREQWDAWLGRADAVVMSVRHTCPRPVLEWAPRLRAVVAPAIGVDTIDVAAATELGIIVAHGATPENFLSMSEAGVMLMLNLLYNPNASRDVLYGRRERPRVDPASAWAQMAMGKTLGLIGCGRIARGIIERLQGWSMRIITTDPFVKADSLPPNVELVDFDTLIKSSDVVCATVALTPETTNLVDDRALRLMKREAF
ncbi:MAG: NAD(P)-dependent oxidoreductase, partial [Burkholderiales bacterium]